jgi:hypothetical protein
MTPPQILFVNPNFEDYLSDSLFHGLRTLLGGNVVDFPKAEYMYRSYPKDDKGRLYGRGFTLYGLLDDIEVDRNRCLDRAHEGEFDLVVFADIWRNFGLFVQWAPQLHDVPLAVLDGADRIEPYPYSGLWWRVRHWWLLPRAHRRARYFKREITPWTYWFRSFLTLPPPIARGVGLLKGIEPIAFSIPEEKVVATAPEKEKDFASHVVDEEVARRIGGQTAYVFKTESDYYTDLRRSRFGVTTKRAGWDCLRHYELAANGCVPCFRQLDRKPLLCAPHGLNETNCIAYETADDLIESVRRVDKSRYQALQAHALRWARANTTRVRAEQFLVTLGLGTHAEGGAAGPTRSGGDESSDLLTSAPDTN